MEKVNGSPKRRASISGYPSSTPTKTCWLLLPSHKTHRNVSIRQPRAPSVCQFPSHVFRESRSLVLLIIISIFSSHLIRPGNGLHPPQCQWSLYQDIERLNCMVETGNSLIVEEEVHGIGPEHAKSLWVQCSSTSDSDSNNRSDFTQSGDSNYYSPSSSALGTEGVQQHNGGGFVLSHGVFMAVPNLRDLRLDNCKISGITPGALSYLPYLQNLTLRAHTSLTTWPSSSSLEIKTGDLRGLPELRHLDLSTTSLSSLPNDFLCFLPSLQSLNLTSCGLRDFRTIGIVPSDPTNPNCGNQIRTLDLSKNHFTLLPPATFATFAKLEYLKINSNSITKAAENSLLNMNNLKVLSVADNQLSSLPPLFFKDNKILQELYLQNNSLSFLGPGLFENLKDLVILDLSSNLLTSDWINKDTFKGLHKMFSLNLANNVLTKIDFRDLQFLQMLNLENNQISHITDDAFIGMPNLYSLVLSNNHLKKIDSFICNGLHLSFVSIDNNKVENVAPDSFNNCSGIQDLNFSGNKLKQVPTAIGVLTNLRTLDLGENNITTVGNASYQSLPNLYGLRLTGNFISFIPKDSFTNLPSLKIINLAKNNITGVEPGAFDNNPNLQAVRLDSNRLTDITGLFKNIPNLLWLNISSNQLDYLKYEEFPQRLQWLDLRSNKIHTLGNCMELENLRIRNLDLSSNFITEVASSNLPDSIENLNLDHNRIHQIQPYTFYRKPNLTRVVITHNQLVRVDENALRLGPDRAASNAEIFIGHNPLLCDCSSMEWLQNINSDDTSGHYPIIQDVADVKCTLSFDRLGLYEPIPYLSIEPSQFLCNYSSICFQTCRCCDYSACDCEMSCPDNCSCYHDATWSSNVVECSGHTSIPSRLPMDATVMYLDNNNHFQELESHGFIGKKNLRILYLNNTGIERIQNNSFSGLKLLTILHLEDNQLTELNYEFEGLDSLEELYLHQNSISWIGKDTFSTLHRLTVLWLHGNNLVDLPVWQVTTNIGRLGYTLTDITLRGNEFSCDCNFSSQLKDWLVLNRAKISDASQVQCVDQVSSSSSSSSSSASNAALHSVGQNKSQTELVVVRLLDQKNPRCSQTTDLSILEPTKSTEADEFNLAEYVPWLVCIPGVILIVILIVLLSYYWRHSLRVWFHAHCGLRLGSCREPPAERDKLFDGFVSYSSKDEAWVRQVLAAELERNDPPYRLCLRYRDLPIVTGGTYLADTIVQATEASRRTILVLSHHFLKGEWSRTDVKSAHHSVLKDRHRKVIIILLGDLPSKDLDPDIRLYLKNHTYLNCDDKKFWEKLRYALPDVKVKVPVFRGIHGRTSSRNNSQHRSSGPPLQSHQHLHHHHHHPQQSPNLSQAHHLTHLGPNTQNNISSPLIGPPPPLTAPPVPGLLANLPPNIPNGALGPVGHHGAIGMGGPVTTVIGAGMVGNPGMNMSSMNSNNSGSQRAPQRHSSIVNSANPNNRQNTAIHI
ncbi:unnamed protein product [Orchesella dallaii]|uniref:TIR domain-containing protein n=1 Tax=Orchesella dallaii TaxID=48710 RepID=A0ABP1QME7_9HEXA